MNYKVHEIKLLEDYCDAVLSGEKTFEVRENDRGYQKGDYISFIPVSRFGLAYEHPVSEKKYIITYVHSGLGLKNGYVVLGIEDIVISQQKKGRWIRVNEDKLRCSECEVIHFIAMYPYGRINYCPNCGAKMEVEEYDA